MTLYVLCIYYALTVGAVRSAGPATSDGVRRSTLVSSNYSTGRSSEPNHGDL